LAKGKKQVEGATFSQLFSSLAELELRFMFIILFLMLLIFLALLLNTDFFDELLFFSFLICFFLSE